MFKTLTQCISAIALLLSVVIQVNGKEDAQLVADWNLAILDVAEEQDGFLTLKGVRAAAMAHLAMHDAINAVKPHYRAYQFTADNTRADLIAAAVYSAYRIANDQYPDKQNRWDEIVRKWLKDQTNPEFEAGKQLGINAANRILQYRQHDNWDGDAEYSWHPMGPGVYAEFNQHSGTPQGFVFGAGWAEARPFTLTSNDQFRAPPPPAIKSREYLTAFNEVKNVGKHNSETRSDDQTHLAMWWKDFAENSHNRLARQLTQQHKLNLHQAARLFALLNTSIFDAYINVFENKFHYNHWRPYTAIRWAEHDGNPSTQADPSWTNTHNHTYAFPSYPSAHGTACAAAMTVLAETFGNDVKFVMETAEVDKAGPFSGKINMNPVSRSFNGFDDAAMECGLSRIYLGIHFRYDSIEGVKLGKRIGDYVVNSILQVK